MPSGLRIDIVMQPEAIAFSRVFSRIGHYVTDLRVPFGEIEKDFRSIERRRFDAEGPGWARLSPRYAAWKAMRYPGKTILRRTDRLYAEATGGYEKRIGRLDMLLAIRTPYAKFHQTGTRRMPRRKVVDVQEPDKRRWGKIIQAYAMKIVRRAYQEEGVA